MKSLTCVGIFLCTSLIYAQDLTIDPDPQNGNFDPSSLIWFDEPAEKWEEAVPVGNGRLGAIIFGGVEEEEIQLNEETYWSGGPYSTTKKGGYKVLPEIQKHIFAGERAAAHLLFSEHLLGYPVEQQKYQSLGSIHLFNKNKGEVDNYARWLDLKTGLAVTEYSQNGIAFKREVFASPVDQVILIRISADTPGSINLKTGLRGIRNGAHSNYATDNYTMGLHHEDELMIAGKSADYLGVEGKLRYEARLKIIFDLFGYYLDASGILEKEDDFSADVKEARKRLVPPQIGKMGNLQEWADDWPPKERAHRHFSHMYGLYPGNVLSAKRTPEFIDPCKAVLEQRGDGGTGFSRAWKMALWARLYDGERGLKIFKGYLKEQACPQLFAKCFSTPQVDGTFGVGAAITEMIMQSHEGVIDLLPALPAEWNSGSFEGVCARGGFELDIQWEQGEVIQTRILSRSGEKCRIDPGIQASLTHEGKKVRFNSLEDGSIEFDTKEGETYLLSPK